jgi:hypothetical protein
MAFLRKIAMRVSRSGGWTSVMRPHLEPAAQPLLEATELLRADVTDVMTTCLLALCSVLKVWKNSSCVCSLPARNWMSSMRSTSTSR